MLFFDDLNFDGYLDIHLLSRTTSNITSFINHGYVWNPELGQFVRTNLDEIVNFSLDPEMQVVRGGWSSWDETRERTIWKFVDGEFVMTNELWLRASEHYRDEDGALWHNYLIGVWGLPVLITERELIDGEMVDVWPIITYTDEGKATMYEHLFGEDSIWFPGGGLGDLPRGWM